MSFNYKDFARDIKQYSRELADQILEADGTHRHQPGSKYAGWVCINNGCSSGSGDKGTGLTEKDGLFSCWSCGYKGDILNLIGLKYGLTDSMEIAKKAAELAGIDLERYSGNYPTQFNTQQKKPTKVEAESQADFILEAAKHIEETDYHRGINLETLKKYKVGFVSEYRHTEKSPAVPALIIPTSDYSYIARRTDTDEKADKVRKKGQANLFNSQALYTTTRPVIFITEGELDALSIIDAGGDAVGLGGTNNYTKLAKIIEENGKPKVPLAIVLDNDEPGEKAAEQLTAELDRLGVKYYKDGVHIYPDGTKDANEALNRNRESFTAIIKAVEGLPEAELAMEAEQYRQECSVKAATTDFISKVVTEYTAPIKSGWESLDKLLDGGIYPGLYFIGALSSMGKTTFALQMADQMAETGHDILIISLEQSKDELMAKTLSRYTYLIESERVKPNYHNAKTVRGILDGSRYQFYNREEHNLIEAALDKYRRTAAAHLFILEGRGNIGTAEIREAVERHYRLTGKAPVIFIDYLQIIKAADFRSSDKQNTDKAVGDLYRIARDFKTPVLAISSFNRDSYNADASMSSFKESGGIEYSGDYVIALQPRGLEEGDSNKVNAANKRKVKETKAAKTRYLEAVILKNRSGATEVKCNLEYNAMFNYMEDRGIPDEDTSDYSFTRR